MLSCSTIILIHTSQVPCSGDVWVESSAAGFFAEAQLKFSPVEGDKKLSVDQQRGHKLLLVSDPLYYLLTMKGCRAAAIDSFINE